jgi:hypothetical protein
LAAHRRNVTVSTLLGTDCTNAAFSERLDVYAMATPRPTP